MPRKNAFTEDSRSVQAHSAIIQSVIGRMAANSSACKGWCIALVSAILVVVADKGRPEYALIALIPASLFLLLDAYYLSLERRFRNSYNDFITKLHKGKLSSDDLFDVGPEGPGVKAFLTSLVSFSVWPFYLALVATIFVVKALVIPAA
jgi:hypothetical protein